MHASYNATAAQANAAPLFPTSSSMTNLPYAGGASAGATPSAPKPAHDPFGSLGNVLQMGGGTGNFFGSIQQPHASVAQPAFGGNMFGGAPAAAPQSAATTASTNAHGLNDLFF